MIAATTGRGARNLSRGVVLLPAVVVIVGVVLAPLFALFIGSIIDTQGDQGILTSRNYVRFFSDPFFLGVLWRTYRVAAIATLICLVIGWPVAYQLSRTTGRALRAERLAWKSVMSESSCKGRLGMFYEED